MDALVLVQRVLEMVDVARMCLRRRDPPDPKRRRGGPVEFACPGRLLHRAREGLHACLR